MVAVDTAKTTQPPYVSFRTLLNFLERLEQGGIPQHIDRHYWGDSLSGSSGHALMGALRFLGLIQGDGNEPTETLERLAQPTQRKQALAEVLQECYAALFVGANVDLARTTIGHLDKAFGEQYDVDGEPRRKAVTFLVHAAQFAEMSLSTSVTGKTRQRRAPTKTTTRAKRTATTASAPPAEPTARIKQPPPPSSPPTASNSKTVAFKLGGSITIVATYNPFDLETEEEEFARELINLVRGFEQGASEDSYLVDDDEEEG